MDPEITGEVTIQLDKPVTIKFGHYTPFRVSLFGQHLTGGLAAGFGFHQVLIYIWTMLQPKDVARFQHPEDLGQFITLDNFADYIPPLLEAIQLAQPAPPDKKKRPR